VTETSVGSRSRLLDSLKFDAIRSRHDDIKPALQDTCRWFLTEQMYLDWFDTAKYEDHHGFLWISGKPGAGKSTMMKHLYSHVAKTRKQDSDVAVVAFFFNARGEELEKSTVGLYRLLLFQIISVFRDLPLSLDPAELQDDEKGGRKNWTLPALQNLFQHIVENLEHRQLICFIDALDECDENQVWTMIDFSKTSAMSLPEAQNGFTFVSRAAIIHALRPSHAYDKYSNIRKAMRGISRSTSAASWCRKMGEPQENSQGSYWTKLPVCSYGLFSSSRCSERNSNEATSSRSRIASRTSLPISATSLEIWFPETMRKWKTCCSASNGFCLQAGH
jgi:hypothetical protein